ncbi:DUF4271 domain-containing protein [Chitinophaga pendula]|uniref:DUF4271 domain-containing protein n=1 Tax=Chitinophaga TaxID=79328 RepID=UPI0012FD5862|nr:MULTISPECIES: DUF4271 domain-containing protein [Chitinophaga]UCJ06965.1 DUF4271 domain-containing protein [Chitinophaga pendula]
MRNWLSLLFILLQLHVFAQTDSSANKAPVRRATPAPTTTRPRPDTARASAANTVAPRTAAPRTAPPRPATDSTRRLRDTTRLKADSLLALTDTASQPAKVPLKQVSAYDTFMKELAQKNIYLQPGNKTRYYDLNKMRPFRDMDWLVYTVAGVLLLLGVVRLVYLKFFSDLFRAFLNPTLSQRQLKDQLSQSPLPNFVLNVFFAISMGLYLYLIMYRQQYAPNADAWILIPGLVILVAVIYSLKYVVLRFCGWLFGSAELADAYIFILYLINKVLGILLAPFLVLVAFCEPEIARAFMYISIFFIVLLAAYRYIRSYSVVRQYLSFSKLHFFLYLCAFEVAPVLILTKVLLIWLTGNP